MCNRKWAVYVGYKILPRLPSEPIDSRVPPTSTVLIVNFQLSLLLVAVGQKRARQFRPTRGPFQSAWKLVEKWIPRG